MVYSLKTQDPKYMYIRTTFPKMAQQSQNDRDEFDDLNLKILFFLYALVRMCTRKLSQV